jgi:hypothetical protein
MKTVKGTLATGFTVLMAAFMMVGCGKNSDNGQPAAVANPYGAYGQCASCVSGGVGTQAAQIMVTDTLGEVMQLQLFSNQTGGYTYPQSGYGGQGGQVAATGIITFPQAFPNCGIAAGQYQLQPYQQPGMWSGNTVSNLTLVGQGPTTLMVTISNLFFTSPNRANVNGFINVNSPACNLTMY